MLKDFVLSVREFEGPGMNTLWLALAEKIQCTAIHLGGEQAVSRFAVRNTPHGCGSKIGNFPKWNPGKGKQGLKPAVL